MIRSPFYMEEKRARSPFLETAYDETAVDRFQCCRLCLKFGNDWLLLSGSFSSLSIFGGVLLESSSYDQVAVFRCHQRWCPTRVPDTVAHRHLARPPSETFQFGVAHLEMVFDAHLTATFSALSWIHQNQSADGFQARRTNPVCWTVYPKIVVQSCFPF